MENDGLLSRLAELSKRLVEDRGRPALPEALDLLVEYLPGRAAVAVIDGQVEAELGYAMEAHAELARGPARALAGLVEESTEIVALLDVRNGPFADANVGIDLHQRGYVSALIAPIAHRDHQFGAIVIWLDELFESTQTSESLLAAVAGQLALAMERDSRSESAEGGLLSLGEMNRLASLGMLLDSSLHALRTPSSSLVIQLDELRRQLAELAVLLDPEDPLLGDAVADLQQTVDDMAVAATVVRQELTSLADVSEKSPGSEQIHLSRLVHEAVTIARPELEQRGFVVEEFFAQDGIVEGDRQAYLHVVLGLLFALGRSGTLGSRLPVLEVLLDGDDLERRITVRSRRTDIDDGAPLPDLSDGCRSQLIRLGGHLDAGPGIATASFRAVSPASRPAPTTSEPESKKILIVDDDPMFARALRRALNAHDVRICGTAGEAELLLLQGAFVPDLVVCDLWLPGSSGRTLHQRIQVSLPKVARRFIFVSGAPLTERDRAYFSDVGCLTMTKPVQVDDLLRAASISTSKPGRLYEAS